MKAAKRSFLQYWDKAVEKGKIMRKRVFQKTFLALSVAACLITTSALAQTHSKVAPSSPTGTTGTRNPANSNIDQSNPGAKSSTLGTVNSGLRDQAMQESDQKLNAQIREAFNRDSALREASHSVILTTNDGVVTLSGSVATEKEKKDLEDKIQLITGVSRVQNEVQIAPSSSSSTISPTTSIR